MLRCISNCSKVNTPTRRMHITQARSADSLKRQEASRFPRLPIPPLSQTLRGYLTSLIPWLDEEARCSGRSAKDLINERFTLAAEFEAGLGQKCQERLQKLDQNSPFNWLDDNFWLKKVYHESRLPLLIHSNWWLALRQDPRFIPLDHTPVMEGFSYTQAQLQRAAWMIYRILVVKQQIEQNDLYPVSAVKEHWARRPCLAIFNACRIPMLECDMFSAKPDTLQQNARRIVVLMHGTISTLEVVHADGILYRPENIYNGLRNAALDAGVASDATPVSILTSSDRDTWANNRNYLSQLSSRNEANLKKIDNSLFAVALDSSDDLPSTTLSDHDTQYDNFLHSIRSGREGQNRWFDKGFTVIVRPDAEAGMLGEHSPCDALVPSMVADEALVEPMASDFPRASTSSPAAEMLRWDVDDHLKNECDKAARDAMALIEDSDDSLLWFRHFGCSWLTQEKLAPDAFIQMAFQLAWFRDQGGFTAVYETALTRMFLHGRTETIRSLTPESRHFVLAMNDATSPNGLRYSLLVKAIQTHTALTRKAITGRGIDRHLMGLQLVMEQGETSQLFDDPLFAQSQTWRLSTSGLSAGERFIGTGFGSPYHDGYGIAYMAAPEHLRFGIESKHSCSKTSTQKFKGILSNCLLEMQDLCIVVRRVEAHL